LNLQQEPAQKEYLLLAVRAVAAIVLSTLSGGLVSAKRRFRRGQTGKLTIKKNRRWTVW